MRIAVIAGEPSGDRLAAGMIRAILARRPECDVFGMAGPAMRAAGCTGHFGIEHLSVMGISAVLASYPRLKRLQRSVRDRYLTLRPDVVVGVDVPDFVLPIERALKDAGIRTVHFVSPTVWAWRPGRVHQVARAADRLLAIFPFEPDCYLGTGLRVEYIGHPYADEIPLEPRRDEARDNLGVGGDSRCLALLPGSRRKELLRHAEPFLRVAAEVTRRQPGLRILCAPVDAASQALLEQQRAACTPGLPVIWCAGRARETLTAADVALVASGTATLEALLCRCPQVVAYRTSWLDYTVLRPLLRVSSIALANIVAGDNLVPEFVQGQLQPPLVAEAIMAWLNSPRRVAAYRRRCDELHRTLRQGAMQQAAAVVLDMAGGV
ncbi:MAG: lipid-A-disaccharide synthase [Gammaproteobacteria bacterium]|nr:lipid-A-disaccharide synthase [Gammaproteobacteria bacterium]